MMITLEQAKQVQGKPMMGTGNSTLGTVDGLYADREDGHPTFATVTTGASGSKTSFVPLDQAEFSGEQVTVPYDKDKVAGAPTIDPDSDISPQEENKLYSYYGLSGGQSTTGTPVGRDTSGPTTDEAMTRSEERLNVGTEQRETGRARLRKVIVSEQQSATVPVSKTTATVSTEPITDANRDKAMDGPELTEAEYEVPLTQERATVSKETVPVERVRLGTETVTEQQQVTEQVRKEQIDTEGDVGGTGGNPRR